MNAREQIFEIFRKEGEICPKCIHYKTCQKPCYPVKSYLIQAQSSYLYEKHARGEDGEEITILLSKYEIHSSELGLFGDNDPPETNFHKPDRNRQPIFSTETESPFLLEGPDAVSKQTGVFIDRFFNRMTFEDLAVKYDLDSRATASNLYRLALERIRRIIEILEKERGAKYKIEPAKEKLEALRLPRSHRYFLLHALFDLDAKTISRIEGNKDAPSHVQRLIIEVRDRLRAGKIELFEFKPAKQ